MIKPILNILFSKVFTISILLTLSTLWLNAESPKFKPDEIPVYDFNELSPWLKMENDSIYIINFWATWCAPCVREIPDFEKISSEYSSAKVKVLFVSLDFPDQMQSRVIPFIERMNMKSQVVLLDDSRMNTWIPLVDEGWTGAIPGTLIYGKGYREFFEKELKYADIQAIIVPLIN